MIDIVIADDHHLIRLGLRAALAAQPDMRVVGEASSGPEVLQAVARTRPQVLALDVGMPQSVVTETIAAVMEMAPSTRILVLTIHDDPLYAAAARDAGASGYLVKNTRPDTLLAAIRALAAGEARFAPSITPKEQPRPSTRTEPTTDAPAAIELPVNDLSKRERQVLHLLARGFTHKEVAAHLSLSVNTVGTYRSRIGQKLGLHSRAELSRYVAEITPDDRES